MSKTVRSDREDRIKTNYYVSGNTVRRLEGDPEERRQRQQEREERIRRRERRNAVRRNVARAMSLDWRFALFFSMSLILVGAACCISVYFQLSISTKIKNISKLESDVADLRTENDARQKRIELTTDLDKVKEEALRYGMKYATEDQIIYYTIEENDFMDQYFNIPNK